MEAVVLEEQWLLHINLEKGYKTKRGRRNMVGRFPEVTFTPEVRLQLSEELRTPTKQLQAAQRSLFVWFSTVIKYHFQLKQYLISLRKPSSSVGLLEKKNKLQVMKGRHRAAVTS